ncbi:MAG: hypothetical protein K2Q14_06035 [Gammaproteobacteria bacterium]|nr:hypothetical protein [Gammaproteobacteria bacterium]
MLISDSMPASMGGILDHLRAFLQVIRDFHRRSVFEMYERLAVFLFNMEAFRNAMNSSLAFLDNTNNHNKVTSEKKQRAIVNLTEMPRERALSNSNSLIPHDLIPKVIKQSIKKERALGHLWQANIIMHTDRKNIKGSQKQIAYAAFQSALEDAQVAKDNNLIMKSLLGLISLSVPANPKTEKIPRQLKNMQDDDRKKMIRAYVKDLNKISPNEISRLVSFYINFLREFAHGIVDKNNEVFNKYIDNPSSEDTKKLLIFFSRNIFVLEYYDKQNGRRGKLIWLLVLFVRGVLLHKWQSEFPQFLLEQISCSCYAFENKHNFPKNLKFLEWNIYARVYFEECWELILRYFPEWGNFGNSNRNLNNEEIFFIEIIVDYISKFFKGLLEVPGVNYGLKKYLKQNRFSVSNENYLIKEQQLSKDIEKLEKKNDVSVEEMHEEHAIQDEPLEGCSKEEVSHKEMHPPNFNDIASKFKQSKVSKPEEAAIVNLATQIFLGKGGEPSHLNFRTWYHPQVCHYLLQLATNQTRSIRVLFDDDKDDNNTDIFKKQLRQLIRLGLRLNRPALFISKEPGAKNHFICGLIKERKLLLINPLGITDKVDCYNTLADLKKDGTIADVWLSEHQLQCHDYEDEGLVSCGPMTLELATHILTTFTGETLDHVWSELLKENPTEMAAQFGLSYYAVAIDLLLPDTLKGLLNISNYESKIVEIRKKHHLQLQTLPIELAKMKNMSVDDYLTQCVVDAPAQVVFEALLFGRKDIDKLPEYQVLEQELNGQLLDVDVHKDASNSAQSPKESNKDNKALVNSIDTFFANKLEETDKNYDQGYISDEVDTSVYHVVDPDVF